MDRLQKFLRKVDGKQKSRVVQVLDSIHRNELQGLDIKPLKGHPKQYRCRVGDIRIIFIKNSLSQNIVIDMDFRGNIYKK